MWGATPCIKVRPTLRLDIPDSYVGAIICHPNYGTFTNRLRLCGISGQVLLPYEIRLSFEGEKFAVLRGVLRERPPLSFVARSSEKMNEILKTPQERFANLPGFPWSPHSRDDLVGFAEYVSCAGRSRGRRGGGVGFDVVGAQRAGRYGRLVPGCVCDWVLVRVPLFFEEKISPDALITGR